VFAKGLKKEQDFSALPLSSPVAFSISHLKKIGYLKLEVL